MRRDTPTWDAYLAGFARHAASKSKDPTQVGAVLVADDGRSVLLTGYNGPPASVADLPERFERPAKYLYATHAEMNVIATAARHGIRTAGCVLYVSHHPCSACSRLIIQAGIRRVYFGEGTTSMPPDEFRAAKIMFCEAGVIALPTPPNGQ